MREQRPRDSVGAERDAAGGGPASVVRRWHGGADGEGGRPADCVRGADGCVELVRRAVAQLQDAEAGRY